MDIEALEVIEQKTEQQRLPITSYSRLDRFVRCQEYYNKRYVLKDRPPDELSLPLIKGSLVHEVLEEYLDPSSQLLIDDALQLMCINFAANYLPGFRPEELFEFGCRMGDLMFRASARCTASNAIRNQDGSVPKDLQGMYQPRAWTNALKEAGLYQLRLQFDNRGAQANRFFIKESLAYLIGDVFAMTRYWRPPAWYKRTLHVELPISTDETNKVPFPGKGESLYFNAYLDWVFETKDDLVIICDHKTMKDKPSVGDVAHHEQLNLYAAFYKYIYGRWPDGIAINHLISGEIIVAPVNTNIVAMTLHHFSTLQKQIDSGVYVKRHPTEYLSPCIKRDWRSKAIKEVCPYLQQCWPTYFQIVEQEILASQHLN